MPDSTVRPGPPIPPSLAEGAIADDAATPVPAGAPAARRGPYGLPFPRLAVRSSAPAGSAAPERQPGNAVPSGTPVREAPRESGEPARRPGVAWPRSGSTTAFVASPLRIVVIALVVTLVVGALWLDRDRHEPVAGYGVIPQSGETSALMGGSGLNAGDPAPNFRLLAADSEIVELASLRGQPVVLHFWTTWCLDCAAELPVLQDLSGRYGDRLHVIGIDVGETAGRVRTTAARNGARYPMLLDRDEEISRAYGVTTWPVTIMIDANGIVSGIQSGPFVAGELENQIDALVAGQ